MKEKLVLRKICSMHASDLHFATVMFPHITKQIENNTTIINNNTEINIAEKIEIEEEVKETKEVKRELEDKSYEVDEEIKIPSRQEKKKENKVDEDFFQLIDSMYKERVDE